MRRSGGRSTASVSTLEQVTVPLKAGGQRWGSFELAFRGEPGSALWRWLNQPLVVTMLFITLRRLARVRAVPPARAAAPGSGFGDSRPRAGRVRCDGRGRGRGRCARPRAARQQGVPRPASGGRRLACGPAAVRAAMAGGGSAGRPRRAPVDARDVRARRQCRPHARGRPRQQRGTPAGGQLRTDQRPRRQCPRLPGDLQRRFRSCTAPTRRCARRWPRCRRRSRRSSARTTSCNAWRRATRSPAA